MRVILLAVLAETKLPAFFPLFTEHLQSDNERLQYWATVGLKNIGTREAKMALRNAGISGM